MIRTTLRKFLVLGVGLLALAPAAPMASVASARIDVLRRDGSTTQHVTDGDTLRLRVTLPETATSSYPVDFARPGGTSLAGCTIEKGQAACETAPFSSLGWYWETAGNPGRVSIEARLRDRSRCASGRLGAVSLVQRFGSALNAHVHVWTLPYCQAGVRKPSNLCQTSKVERP